MSVKNYFLKHAGVPQAMCIRGDKEIMVTIGSARLHVCRHGKKLFVIALKYEGEEEYRFIIASDRTWRTIDIVEAYSQAVIHHTQLSILLLINCPKIK